MTHKRNGKGCFILYEITELEILQKIAVYPLIPMKVGI